MAVKAQAQVEITSVKDIKDAAEAARDTAASSKITADSAATAAGTAQTAADAAQSIADSAGKAARDAQTKAEAASTAASTAQSSAATAAQAAATAQSTADAAKASASSASNAASAAQTKANEAASAAATAQSKADSAGTAASKAQSSANAAGEAASSAQAAAEAAQTAADGAQADIDSQKEYFWHDANGAHVLGSKTAATRYRTDIDSEGIHIKDVSGEIQEVAKFTAEGVRIGKEGEAHQEIVYNGWTFFGPEYWKIAAIKDQRDRTGYAKYSETVTAYSGQNYVTSTHTINKNEATATIEGEPVTVSSVKNKYTVYFEEVFTKDTQVTITYDTADQISSFELGLLASATGAEAVAFGTSKAKGDRSLAFGLLNESSGKNSFSHGYCTTASGEESHAEGSNTIASGKDSHAEGKSTIAAHWQQHVQGTYNDNLEEDAFEIGNGTSDTNRSNAFRVTKEGDVYNCGDIVPGKITGIANMIYPVGSIYMSVSSTSPETLFGGTWERIQDRFLLAAGSTYSAGGTGGEAEHTLTVDEIPSHSHQIKYRSKILASGSSGAWALGAGTYDGYSSNTVHDTGGNGKHNNMPPYLTVYIWKRTA